MIYGKVMSVSIQHNFVHLLLLLLLLLLLSLLLFLLIFTYSNLFLPFSY